MAGLLQWGPALKAGRNRCVGLTSLAFDQMLQWGPALKAGRNSDLGRGLVLLLWASMGPGPKGREERRR